jgi:hypothetical protein
MKVRNSRVIDEQRLSIIQIFPNTESHSGPFLRGRVSAFPPPKDVPVSTKELVDSESVDSDETEDFQESDNEDEWEEDDFVPYSAKGSLKGSLKEPDWEMLTPQR